MAFLRAVLWGVPLLLLLIAVGVVLARGRIAAIGGLDVPYPDATRPLSVGEGTTLDTEAPGLEWQPVSGEEEPKSADRAPDSD